MRLLYSFSLQAYALIIRVVYMWNPKAKEWIVGRKKKYWQQFDSGNRRVIWFHCASLGEFDQGLPLMNSWKEKFPDDLLVVTFFSPSGMRYFDKRDHQVDQAFYLPLDTSKNAKEFVSKIKPQFCFFVKYEFWNFHLQEAKSQNCKLYSISTIFRENQHFFKFYGGFYRNILSQFDHFFLQDENSHRLLKGIGFNNSTIVGDLRFDRVNINKLNADKNAVIDSFINENNAFLIGSSWPDDEKYLLPFINSVSFKTKVIIAPHDISEKHIQQIERNLSKTFVRYTQYVKNDESQVLILDTIGHLMNAYQYGLFAYVGGGFKGSLHNILEPAAFHLPVLFGPKHSKFPEANLFKKLGIGFEVMNEQSLSLQVDYIQKNHTEIVAKMRAFMMEQEKVSAKIMKHLF